jgi:hypothetical protein
MREIENVDIFDSIDAGSETLDFLEKKGGALDGIFRPKITDKKKGYVATIRFLPNLTKEGKVAQAAIEKHQHYVDFKNHPELAGYYDCMKNFTDKCDFCTMYWKLFNSKNASDVEKAALISRNTKYYSYILVIEDEQNRELEGKILIYPYGYKIKEKIKDQKDGISGDPCNVFDIANGKNFKLVMKQLGEFPNYDSSTFMDISPIQIPGKDGKFVKAPVEIDEKTGKSKITNAKAKEKITTFLMDRIVNLEDHMPKAEWTSEEKYKVTQILEILNGNEINSTQKAAKSSKNDDISTKEEDTFGEDTDDAGDFFELDSDDQ